MFRLFRYLKPYWPSCLLLIASIGLQVWCSLQLPALMASIVNNGIASKDPAFTQQVGLKMLLFTLVAIAGAVLSHFLSGRIGASFLRDLRAEFYQKVLSFSAADIDKFTTASLITRTVNDIFQVQHATMMMLTMLLRAPLMGVGAIIQSFRIAADMTWIIALAVATVFTISLAILFSVMPKFKLIQQLTDRLTLLVRENLTGLKVVRAFNNEAKEKHKFTKANQDITNVHLFINRIMSLEDPLLNLIFQGTTLLILWVGIGHYEIDPGYIGNTIAFAQYAGDVIMSFLILTMLLAVLPRANVSAKRINEVLKTRTKIVWQAQTKGQSAAQPSVEFKKVSFAYPGAEQNVLTNISFTARAGQTTAFVGSTGSGKSTLISLIPRFYEASAGQILVNGLPLEQYAEDDLMRRIAYVPQRGLLFAGTIRSNIAFSNPKLKLSQVKRAAEIAQATSFIARLDNNFEAHVAQGGANLSGGQKQRLSIARAIAKCPEIYIFDDAFSALDMKTDRKLRAALKSGIKDAVVLIVAQRISTIKDADQIIVLEDGKIKGIGKHRTLLKDCETYREIVRSQLSEQEFKQELRYAA